MAVADEAGARDALAILVVQAIARRDGEFLRAFVPAARAGAAGAGAETGAAVGALADVAQAGLEQLVLADQRAALLADPEALSLLRRLVQEGATAEDALTGAGGSPTPAAAELLLQHRLAIRRRGAQAILWEVTPRGRDALGEVPPAP